MSEEQQFGRWLRERRKALQLTQADLAERVGISFSAVQKLEGGQRQPSQQVAQLLATALQIAPGDRARFLRAATGISPAGAVAAAPPSNLPQQLTPLIGRAAALAELTGMLKPAAGATGLRLLTLTGPPGIGKTRLALQAAAALRADFADGVCAVMLAPVQDAALVVQAIATALGLREAGSEPLSLTLKDHLREKSLLLLLDNFEQVIAAAPALVDLLWGCGQVKMLVTSREALRVRGERQYVVPPLAAPPLERSSASPAPPQVSPAELAGFPAVELFVDRAAEALPGFRLSEENAAAVAAICARLEGVPLAVELVAARVRLLPPAALLAQLLAQGGALPVLVGGPRDLPDRHRTLRAAINWSYDLLAPAEQLLLRRVGLFVGGCTPSSVEAVCNARGDLGISVVDGLLTLLDKNLIKRDAERAGAEQPRFTMLETLREYALERLAAAGEIEQGRRWHAEYFLALAQTVEPQLLSADQNNWLARLEEEHDNLRAALDWLMRGGHWETAAHLSGSLARFWWVHGHLREGRDWLERVLAHAGELTLAARARVLSGSGLLARNQSDLARAQRLLAECLAIWRELGDERNIAATLKDLGAVLDQQGDFAGAARLYEESLALYRRLGDDSGAATVLSNLGVVWHIQGKLAEAERYYAESITVKRKLRDSWGLGTALSNMGYLLLHKSDFGAAAAAWEEALELFSGLGDRQHSSVILMYLGTLATTRQDYARAAQLLQQSLLIRRELGDRRGVAMTLGSLGELALAQGDAATASDRYRESLRLLRDMGDPLAVVQGLAALARAGAATAPVRAARLFAAVEGVRKAGNIALPLSDQHHKIMTELQQALGEEAWSGEWERGASMSIEEAITFALS